MEACALTDIGMNRSIESGLCIRFDDASRFS